MLVLLETRLQTDWQRQQQNSLNPTSSSHTKKSRPFWNRSRNQPGDWKMMDMTHRKTRLIPLTGGPKPPSFVCILVTVGWENIWRDCVLLIQPTVNVAVRSKLLSTFFRPAHTWRQYASSFGQKTLKWAPSPRGKLLNYSGRRTS